MAILLHCPDCAAKIRAPEQIIGRQVHCPKCDAEFTAAVEEAPAPEPEPAPSQPTPPPAPPEVKEPAPVRNEVHVQPASPPPEEPDEEVDVVPATEAAYDPAYGPPNPVADVLLFRTMIAPAIIQGFFWVGVILCVLTGVVYLIAAIGMLVDASQPASLALLQGLGALGIIVFGPPVLRICCELLILFFRIYDALKEIQAAAEKQRRSGG
jgi:hypothetical protein